MGDTSEVERLIAEERAVIEADLREALGDRDEANERVKRLRAKLDAAPRLHVRRTRKTPKEALPGQGELPARQELDLRGALAGFDATDDVRGRP